MAEHLNKTHFSSWWVVVPNPAQTSSKWFFLCAGVPVGSVGVLGSGVQLLTEDP